MIENKNMTRYRVSNDIKWGFDSIYIEILSMESPNLLRKNKIAWIFMLEFISFRGKQFDDWFDFIFNINRIKTTFNIIW